MRICNICIFFLNANWFIHIYFLIFQQFLVPFCCIWDKLSHSLSHTLFFFRVKRSSSLSDDDNFTQLGVISSHLFGFSAKQTSSLKSSFYHKHLMSGLLNSLLGFSIIQFTLVPHSRFFFFSIVTRHVLVLFRTARVQWISIGHLHPSMDSESLQMSVLLNSAEDKHIMQLFYTKQACLCVGISRNACCFISWDSLTTRED